MDRAYFYELLHERGLTRQAFEKLHDIPTSNVSIIMRGKHQPNIRWVKKISRSLGLNAEQVDKLFHITERYGKDESN